MMAEEDGAAPWPALPPDCPLVGAAVKPGTFFRLSRDDDPHDWALPVQRYGLDWFAALDDDVLRCRAHAFSIYSNIDDLHWKKKAIPKFRNHRIMRIEVTNEMGVLLHNEPEKNSHHCWWPSDGFAPPPATCDEVAV